MDPRRDFERDIQERADAVFGAGEGSEIEAEWNDHERAEEKEQVDQSERLVVAAFKRDD